MHSRIIHFIYIILQVMCTDNVKEKTELLYALISGRKLSDLPKISQVMICIAQAIEFGIILDLNKKCSCSQLKNIIVAYCVDLAANLDNLGRARPGLSIGTWPKAEEVYLFTSVILFES